MQIIPAIDLSGGKVVLAKGDDRKAYPILSSKLTSHHDPKKVIKDFLDYYPFEVIYIADLDAISGEKVNLDYYAQLSKQFPSTLFWLDVGIKTYQDWQSLYRLNRVTPIIASETLVESEYLLLNEVKQNSILSLDFKHQQFLGLSALLNQPELWTDKVIVMNLDMVGSDNGPALEQLAHFQQCDDKVKWIAAGGIRGSADLEKLVEQGINSALVASALHQGRLDLALQR